MTAAKAFIITLCPISSIMAEMKEAASLAASHQATLLLAVLLGMRPSCFFGVMSSVGGVPMRGVCVVGGLLVLPGVVVFAGFCVMLSSMCGVFCCLLVMFRSLFGHGVFPLLESWSRLSEQNFRVDKWSICRG